MLPWWLFVGSGMIAGCDQCAAGGAARGSSGCADPGPGGADRGAGGVVADLWEQWAAAARAGSRNSGNSSMPPSSDDPPGRNPPRKQRRTAERAVTRGGGSSRAAGARRCAGRFRPGPRSISLRAPARAAVTWRTRRTFRETAKAPAISSTAWRRFPSLPVSAYMPLATSACRAESLGLRPPAAGPGGGQAFLRALADEIGPHLVHCGRDVEGEPAARSASSGESSRCDRARAGRPSRPEGLADQPVCRLRPADRLRPQQDRPGADPRALERHNARPPAAARGSRQREEAPA